MDDEERVRREEQADQEVWRARVYYAELEERRRRTARLAFWGMIITGTGAVVVAITLVVYVVRLLTSGS